MDFNKEGHLVVVRPAVGAVSGSAGFPGVPSSGAAMAAVAGPVSAPAPAYAGQAHAYQQNNGQLSVSRNRTPLASEHTAFANMRFISTIMDTTTSPPLS